MVRTLLPEPHACAEAGRIQTPGTANDAGIDFADALTETAALARTIQASPLFWPDS
jgi:hypothetical protein